MKTSLLPPALQENNVYASCLLFFLVIFVGLGLASCTVAPSEHDIREIIDQYYSGRNFKVVKLALGEVRSQPMGDKTYMGTSGFIINVRSLTLQAAEDSKKPLGYKKGDLLVLKNGTVTIREDPAKKGAYLLVSISSSLAP